MTEEVSKKLYKVELREIGCGKYRTSYVVAETTHAAYMKVRAYLDEHNIGFRKSRELFRVELIAEDAMYPDCGVHLFI